MTLLDKAEPGVPYLVAEIGANHQGDMDTAKRLIDAAAFAGWHAVKFQKRCLKPGALFTQEELDKPYNGPNSFGATYGEHRRALELSWGQLLELRDYAQPKGLDVGVSVWDLATLAQAKEAPLEFIKIPSACAVWRQLMTRALKASHPLIISMGMCDEDQSLELRDDIWESRGDSLETYTLQCTSSYPTPFDEIHLGVMRGSNARFAGISGHWRGIAIDIAAQAMGARIIERHVTLDRTMKGSDHAASLEPGGMLKLKRDLLNVAAAMGSAEKRVQPSEVAVMAKLRTKAMRGE